MIDTSKLYRLPWTLDHNPNGWIEPTTECQLKCPFCYRGADLDGFVGVHTPFEQVKRDVDRLIELRNVGTISVAGGEPLVYPWVDDLIDYIRSRGVEVMFITNGIRVDEELLEKYKAKQVARIVIHVDKNQERAGIDTEQKANELRQHYCDLFRKVGGISLGFIQPIGLPDIDDLEVLLPFFKKNADVVDLVAFNRLQPVDDDSIPKDQVLTGNMLFERVRKIYGLEYGAYLPKTHSDEISWLFGQAIFSGNEYIGSFDKHAFEFFQKQHLRKTGQYLHCTRDKHVTPKFLMYAPFNRSIRKMARRYFGLNGSKGPIHHQLVLLINTPKKMADGDYDRCVGCPDAMLYNGKLVPSCMLELIKDGLDVEAC